MDRREAERIAADAGRLAAAHSYWQARLSTVGEDILTTGTFSSHAMTLAAATPNAALNTLVPETAHVFDGTDTPVRSSGCLVSLAEISTFVGAGSAPGALAAAIKTVSQAVAAVMGPPPATDVARGIIACREVFDAVRRYRICRDGAAANRLEISTLLALYRQEGSLCMSPPASSYLHAPLITTAPGTCRPDEVPFGFDMTMSRIGFNFVYDRTTVGGTNLNPQSQGFGLVFRNLLTLGGLDSIVNPRVSPADEARHLLNKAKGAVPRPPALDTLITTIRSKLTPSQRTIFDDMCIGLVMCEVEATPTATVPEVGVLLDGLKTTMTDLVSAYASTRRGSDIMLTAQDDAAEARLVLALQARWFESRTRLPTLLARADRAGAVAFERLPPFLAYLRFNVGDALFAGILLRATGAMNAARAAATSSPWPHADAFLTALGSSSLTNPDVLRARKLVRDHWGPNVATETAWRHIGLVDALRAAGVPPMWLTSPPPPPPVLRKTADVAKELVDLLVGADLLSAIEQLLYTAPISKVLALGITDALPTEAARRAPLVKTHSFDRLRRVFSKALTDAGLGAPP